MTVAFVGTMSEAVKPVTTSLKVTVTGIEDALVESLVVDAHAGEVVPRKVRAA